MTKIKRFRTDFLFPKSSLLIGFGSIFNISGKYYKFNGSKTSMEADYKAIQSDWGIVGQDINEAIKELKKELNIH